MKLPDLSAYTEPVAVLTREHQGQHRCVDGRYYTPHDFQTCPIQTAVRILLDLIWEALTLPHRAAHDDAHVDAVTLAATGLNPAELMDDEAAGWRLTFRLALEAHAAQLDPSVTT